MRGKSVLFLAVSATLLFSVGCDDRDQGARRQVHAVRTEVSEFKDETILTNAGQDGRLDSLEDKVAKLCAIVGDQDGQDGGSPDLHDRISSLEATVASLQSTVATVNSSLVVIERYSSKVEELESRLAALSVNEHGDWVITGVNVRIQDAGGAAPPLPGKGNLLVGRDDSETFEGYYHRDPARTGTNNLVVGGANEYLNDGSLILGSLNRSLSDDSVLFGLLNSTTGESSSVLGGVNNEAAGKFSVVSSGESRVSSGDFEFRASNFYANTNNR